MWVKGAIEQSEYREDFAKDGLVFLLSLCSSHHSLIIKNNIRQLVNE